MQNISEIYKLTIGITLTVAFVFTVFITLASMVGWVKFRPQWQQKVLFAGLIVELVSGGVAAYKKMIGLSPSTTQKIIEQPLNKEKDILTQVVKEKEKEVVTVKEETGREIAKLTGKVAERDTQVAKLQIDIGKSNQARVLTEQKSAEYDKFLADMGGRDEFALALAQVRGKNAETVRLKAMLKAKETEIDGLKQKNDDNPKRIKTATSRTVTP